MKKILLLSFNVLIFLSLDFAQTNYQKNFWVKYKTKKRAGKYIVTYTFKDFQGNLCTFEFTMDRQQADRDIQKFGIPGSMLGRYQVTPAVLEYRRKMLKQGLFTEDGKYLRPDYNAMINYYSPYTKPIARWIVEYLKQHYEDTRLNRIKFALTFVQDIPYAVPGDYTRDGKYTGGVAPAPKILRDGYGDCDSKSIFFAGIMCYLVSPGDIVLAKEPNHMYVLIRNDDLNVRENGEVTYFNYNGGTYIVAEPAGPGHFEFGQKMRKRYLSANLFPVKCEQ